MRLLILFTLLALPCWGVYGNGYTYRRTITIDKTKVPNTDQTNFVVVIVGTYPYLAHTTHAGKVTDLNGYDIVFASDNDGASPLDHEIEYYNHATGACAFWVRIPTLATASDTVIYLFYGNSSVTTSQEDIPGTWNANYAGVFHLPNGTTVGYADSTGTATGGSLENTPTAAAGKVDGAVTVTRGAGFYNGVNFGTSTTLAAINGKVISVEAWVKKVASTDVCYILDKTGDSNGFSALWGNTTYVTLTAWGVGSANAGTITKDTNWHHVVLVSDASTVTLYDNGAATANTPESYAITANTNSIGWRMRSGDSALGEGCTVDELRVSTVSLSADWVATAYNNQSSPSTFYAIGAQDPADPTGTRHRMVMVP